MAFLSELVLAESPTDVPAAQGPVQDLVADALSDVGFDVRRISGESTGGHLYARPARRSRGMPSQLLVGHTDTVWPLGTLDDMPLLLENGKLKGPGVFDMKAGLAQIVFALRVLRDLGLDPEVTPVAFFNSDEEIGSPESTLPIQRLAKASVRTFVLEPAFGLTGKIKTARKGGGQFTVTVRGKAAHAGLQPEAGASAILELAHVIQTLHALNDPKRGITVNVGVIDGGLRPNVIAAESRAEVDVRVVTREDAAWLEKTILDLEPATPGVTLEIVGGLYRPPLEPTPRNRALWNAARRAAGELGLRLQPATAGGGSDGNFTSLHTATLDGLGAVGDGAHALHEFVFVDRLAERTALLARLLLLPPDAAAPGGDAAGEAASRNRSQPGGTDLP